MALAFRSESLKYLTGFPFRPEVGRNCQRSSQVPLSSEFGTYKTVKARLWPLLEPFQAKVLKNHSVFPFQVSWFEADRLTFEAKIFQGPNPETSNPKP